MKDKEIIHALSCCSTRNCKFGGCLFDDGNSDDVENCTTEMAKAALDLINRQQEEIEKLKDIARDALNESIKLCDSILEVKAKSISEFAERLKAKAQKHCHRNYNTFEFYYEVDVEDIDKLKKEMGGLI